MKYIIGVDVGATKISAALIFGKNITKIVTHPTESHEGKDKLVANILKIIRIFYNPRVDAIGLGVAGEINHKKGILVSSPNMHKNVKNVPLAKILKKEFGIETYLENDAKCFALAESILGAGKNHNYVVGLTLGTGVGGGIVMHKKIYYGSQGLAGELGHMTITENGELCSCGRRGHLEAYASGTGMVHLYKQFTGKSKDAFAIENSALGGDMHAKRVMKIMADSLGIGLANIINSLNPDIIIVGGGMVQVRALWKPAIALAKKGVLYPALKKTKIVKTSLKEKANVLGAALNAEMQIRGRK